MKIKKIVLSNGTEFKDYILNENAEACKGYIAIHKTEADKETVYIKSKEILYFELTE